MPSNASEKSLDIKSSPARGGQSRLFLRGGTSNKLTPADTFVFKGRTTLDGGLGMSRGEPEDTYAPSDDKGGELITILSVPGSLERQSVNFSQVASASLGESWWAAIRANRPVTMAIPGGLSRQPQDIDDWEHLILIDNATVVEVKVGDTFNPVDEGDVKGNLQISGSISYAGDDLYRIVPLNFAETGDSATTRAVVASAYRETDDGIEYYVAVTNVTSTSPSAIAVRNHLGVWVSQVELACLNNEAVEAMVIVGSYAILPSSANDGHVVVALSDILAGSDSSSLQTSGYTASKGPQAVYARSAGEIIFVGRGGYIYKASSATGAVTVKDAGSATTQDLNKVHGFDDQIVAVGASNAVVVSNDVGNSWTVKTGPSSGDVLTAVCCLAKDIFFVGNENGELYYTLDFGDTWAQVTVGTLASGIHDIQFKGSVGYLVGVNAGAGKLYRSLDGGASWHNADPYIHSIPASVGLTSITLVDANTVLVAGTGAASDGIVLIVEED